MKLEKTDITFRMSRLGDPVASNSGEAVCNKFQRLLYMIPGTDDYNPNMGLDITTRAKRPYAEGARDTEYETQITEQLYTYTDIVPLSVIAIFSNKSLVILLNCQVNNQEFQVQVSSDPNALATVIQPKVI